MAKREILIVEDEKNINDILAFTFSKEGYNPISAYDGLSALSLFEENKPDIVLLDLNLPGMNGMDVCKEIRKTSNVPIIMLTARTQEMDKISGLMKGADDYITKPFSPTELLARVDSLYRRVGMNTAAAPVVSDEIVLGDFVLNTRRHTLTKRGKNIELTQVEFQIIEYFFTNPDTALDRTDILTKVWGESYFGEEKIVDVNIRRLRMKVEDEPSSPKHLMTVWGMGYKWNSGK